MLTLGFLLGETREHLTLRFDDGTTEDVTFEVKNWWCHHATNKGPIRSPFQFDNTGHKVYNASHIFHIPIGIPHTAAGRRVAALQLPGPNDWNTLHVFAMSYIPATQGDQLGDRVQPRYARATRRWETIDGLKAQVVEVALGNPQSVSQHEDIKAWIDRAADVSLVGTGFTTVRPGRVARLMPGDEVVVEVLVTPTGSAKEWGNVEVVVELAREQSRGKSRKDVTTRSSVVVEGSKLVHDFAEWTEDTADIEEHTSPRWFDDAKYGIFIHWGLFSIPAWGDGTRYAEWYDFWLHDDDENGSLYKHHLETYGKDLVYDDFIPQFKADKFDASEWVKFVADTGAKYFVFTTKHHDGYALFDTKETSGRNSLKMGPKRDFLREIMDAAEREQPHLKRGTYFSMPEWFNPLYAPHGRVSFPGGLARNPYTREVEEYNGFVDVGDYIEGLQLPQMRILADDYKTDLMWCDIGLDNHSSAFVKDWYASAAREDRQVAMDNRCGIGGDYDTPEMTKFATVQPHKWETCASMDPESFGFSTATPPSSYRNASDVIDMLVDIVAKGGNLLLNIGPRGDGSLVKEQIEPLIEVGKWLETNGRAIFGTRPFPLLPEVHEDDLQVFITRTEDALYLISIRDLNEEMNIPAPLPIFGCDQISLVTDHGDIALPWVYEEGVLRLDLSKVAKKDRRGHLGYVIEVKYSDCDKPQARQSRDEL